jgi:hypothetical protein
MHNFVAQVYIKIEKKNTIIKHIFNHNTYEMNNVSGNRHMADWSSSLFLH